MASLSERFEHLKASGEKALVLFVTAGDPPLEQLPQVLDALVEGGADVIELGFPFSDPIADGPIIQASSQRALDRGVTIDAILKVLRGWSNPGVPLVAMGYYNTAYRRGLNSFAQDLASVGFSASILSDLTPEESDEWVAASRLVGLDNIFLAAPTSTDARLEEVYKRASGFAYAVSRTGVTGSAQSAPPEALDLVRRIRTKTSLPVCVGFGISQPEHVRTIGEVADGVVIGSWLVDLLHRTWDDGNGRKEIVQKIRALKEATRSIALEGHAPS